jgi:hypothetical protein
MSAVVLYHGSRTGAVGGLYTVDGPCCCVACNQDMDQWEANDAEWGAPPPIRWVLTPVNRASYPRLVHVRSTSFIPVAQQP